MQNKVSKLDRLHDALSETSLTVRQISSRFRVKNPYDLIYQLRNEGHNVASTRTKSRGKFVTRYNLNYT